MDQTGYRLDHRASSGRERLVSTMQIYTKIAIFKLIIPTLWGCGGHARCSGTPPVTGNGNGTDHGAPRSASTPTTTRTMRRNFLMLKWCHTVAQRTPVATHRSAWSVTTALESATNPSTDGIPYTRKVPSGLVMLLCTRKAAAPYLQRRCRMALGGGMCAYVPQNHSAGV